MDITSIRAEGSDKHVVINVDGTGEDLSKLGVNISALRYDQWFNVDLQVYPSTLDKIMHVEAIPQEQRDHIRQLVEAGHGDES